jgi:hypothetical protein
MSTTTTELAHADYWPDNVHDWAVQEFNKAPEGGLWSVDEVSAASKLYAQSEVQYRVVIVHRGDAGHQLNFIQYGRDASNIVLVDFGEPITDFPADHQETVEYLRANGRPILADKLVTMLQNIDEDPDEPEVNIVSLQDMARCLVERGDFADPSIGPDRYSMVYAQWRIMGDGVLVVSFLGDDEILLVAQADRNGCPVDVSKRGRLQDILKEYECLVPRRH